MKAPTAALLATLPLLTAAPACDDEGAAPPPPPANYSYQLQVAFPNLTFVQPVDVQHAGDGSNRLYVVERSGVVKVFANEDTVASAKTFLDISSLVESGYIEQGLLGLAFHPDYETNGRFFVYYTMPGGTNRLARFEVSAGNPDSTDQTSIAVLIDFPKKYANHNGGQLVFGPDGYLYVGIGDGGSAGDPDNNGQDPTTLYGTILRLDVDSQSLGNYGIPPTNPFGLGSNGYRPEIYAFGLRNPWRFGFDSVTGWLWAGDVGQGDWEEIDIIESGGNYGWNCYEGTHPYVSNALCDTLRTQIDPIYEYAHQSGNVCITGGYVYRGPSLSSLSGAYVFGDYNSGRIWAIRYDGADVSAAVEILDTDLRISSFGVDAANELYICDLGDAGGETHLYKLKQTAD